MKHNKEWLVNGAEESVRLWSNYDKTDLYAQGRLDAAKEFLKVSEELDDDMEIPVIPKFVADYIKLLRVEGHNFYSAYQAAQEQYQATGQLAYWFESEENMELYAKAWIYLDFKLVTETKHFMPVPYSDNTYYYLNATGDIDFKRGTPYVFTWSEIEKYFPEIKYMAKAI